MLRFFGLLLASLALASAPLRAEWKADPPAKPSDWKFPDAPIPLPFLLAHTAFADHFGPFALMTSHLPGPTGRVLLDLRTGKPAAKAPLEFGEHGGVESPDILSPDGTYLAQVSWMRSTTLPIRTMTTGAVRKVEIPLGVGQSAWLDSRRLAVVVGFARSEFLVIDAATGAAGPALAIPGTAFVPMMPGSRCFATSPGGRYAAIATDRGIAFLDTTTSKVGLVIGLEWKPIKNLPRESMPPAVAFSADGSQLALLDGDTLRIWRAGDDTPKTVAVARGKWAYSPVVRSLQAIRAGGWLIDAANICDAAGESVRVIPSDGRSIPSRQALDARTVLAVRPKKSGDNELAPLLGSAAKLKPAIVPDIGRAQRRRINPEPFLGSFEPAPLVAAAALKSVRSEPGEPRPLIGLHVARTGRWAVAERDFSDTVEKVQDRAVGIWDASGLRAALEPPHGRRVFGELADDAGYLTLDTKSVGPPTLAFHDPTGEMVCRWQPGADIRYAALVGESRAVTMDSAGRLIGWNLPRCEAEWSLDLPGATVATLGPRGDRIAVGTPTGIHIIMAQSGDHLGSLAAELGANAADGAVCIHGDGTQLVYAETVGLLRRIRVWNLFAERKTKQFEVAKQLGRGCAHLGSELLFLDGGVVDLDRERIVGRFTGFPIRFAQSQPGDGRIWYLRKEKEGTAMNTAAVDPYPRAGTRDLSKRTEILLETRVTESGFQTEWPKGYVPPAEESEGVFPTAEPDDVAPPPPAATGPGWVLIAGCGTAIIFVLGAVSIAMLIWMNRRKKAKRSEPKRRRRPRDEDDD